MLCPVKKQTERTQLRQREKKAAHLSDVHRNVPGGPRKNCHIQDAKILRKVRQINKRYEVDMLKEQ